MTVGYKVSKIVNNIFHTAYLKPQACTKFKNHVNDLNKKL